MKRLATQLWAGEISLRQAFWTYAVFGGLLVNLITHLLLLILIVRDASMVFVAFAFALPIPYNVFVAVAVWRSAGRYEGPKNHAELARIATIILMIGMTVA